VGQKKGPNNDKDVILPKNVVSCQCCWHSSHNFSRQCDGLTMVEGRPKKVSIKWWKIKASVMLTWYENVGGWLRG
jgi:hypothetical protein